MTTKTTTIRTMMMMALALGITGLTGCAADEGASDAEPSVEVNDDVVSPQGEVIEISMNCKGPLMPGMPTPPCKPDLKFTGMVVVQVWAPGNAANLAPGRYITWGFKNDSDKPTPAFKAHVKDQFGNVVRTIDFPAFSAGQSGGVTDIAPYTCGWTRTAVLNVTNTVDEYSTANNSAVYSYPCPRMNGGLVVAP